MKETRKIKISHKIFKLEDLKKLADILIREFSKYENKKSYILFRVDCVDNSTYEDKTINIFKEESPITSKKISYVEMNFKSNNKEDKEKYINLKIMHDSDGDMLISTPFSYYHNYCLVESDDRDWLRSTLKEMEDEIQSIKPQNKIVRYKKILHIATSISIAYSIVYLFINNLPIDTQNKFSAWEQTFLVIIMLFGSYIATMPLFNFLFVKLWPNIELQIGPPHTNIENKRRLFYFFLSTTVILPIIINVLF